MPETVTIANKPFWARILAPFWAIEAMMGLVFAGVGVSWLGGAENGMAWVLIVMGALLAAAGVMMTDVSWRSARLSGAALEFSPEGFRDRRLSEKLVPWDAVNWRVVFNGKSYSLQFDLAPGFRSSYRIPWGQRAMSALNRAFRYPEFTIITLGTGLSASGISGIMTRFKPPGG